LKYRSAEEQIKSKALAKQRAMLGVNLEHSDESHENGPSKARAFPEEIAIEQLSERLIRRAFTRTNDG
jgi:hypothetical protein